MAAALFTLGALALSATAPAEVRAQAPAVDPAAAAQQQAATAKQEAEAARQQAAMASPAAAPAAACRPLPLGTVVAALPPGCAATPVGGVEYYYRSGNVYRAAFQGSTLVYVTAKPE